MFVLVPAASFSYTRGAPKQFKRADLEHPVTRKFCAERRNPYGYPAGGNAPRWS